MFKSLCAMALFLAITTTAYASTSTDKLSYGQKIILQRHSQYLELIYNASVLSGLPMEEIAAFVKIESTFNKNAINHQFKAKGLYQHLDSTWRTQCKLYCKTAGIKPGTNQYDAEASLKLGSIALAEERKKMALATHRSVDDIKSGDLYLSHMYGVDRAIKIINAPKGTKVSKFVAINPSSGLTFYKNKRIMTTDEFRAAANRKLDKEKALFIEPTRQYQVAKYLNEVKDTVVHRIALTAMRH